MLSDIITENGLDLGIATTGNDSIIMSQLPPDQLAYFTASPFPDAIALLEGDDNVLNDNTGRIFYGNQGSDTIIGGGGNDTLFGGQDNDFLEATGGNNILFGNFGNDTLIGGPGNDSLYGGAGNDVIIGGLGNSIISGDKGLDTLTGSGGANQFILASSGADQDVITDFQPGIDKMRLPNGISFNNLQILSDGSSVSTRIEWNGETLVILENVSPSSITNNDFIETGEVSELPTTQPPIEIEPPTPIPLPDIPSFLNSPILATSPTVNTQSNALSAELSNSSQALPDVNEVLTTGLNNAIAQLQDFLIDQNFASNIATAFGQSADVESAHSLIQQLSNGQSLPTFKIISIDEIAGNLGAFDKLTNTVYISLDFLSQNANSPENIANVLLEEIGHSVDSQINAVDASGDEGAIFSELVRDNQLSDEELKILKLKNDHLTVNIDGIDVILELAHRELILQFDSQRDNSVMYNNENSELATWDTGISLFMNDKDPVPGEIIQFELTIDTKNIKPWWGTRWPYTVFGYASDYRNKTTEATPLHSWFAVRNGDWVNPQNWTLEVKDRLGSSTTVVDGGNISVGFSAGTGNLEGNLGGEINFKSNEPNKKPFDIMNYGSYGEWDWLALRNLLTPNNDHGKFFETSIIKLTGEVKAESVFGKEDWLQIYFTTVPIYSFTGGNLIEDLIEEDNIESDEYYDRQAMQAHVYAPFPDRGPVAVVDISL